jgi:hypothetical protein
MSCNNINEIINSDLQEYIVIIRKDDNNFAYDPREHEYDEPIKNFINETFKHYMFSCQYRLINEELIKIKEKYNLDNISVILQILKPNHIPLMNKIKRELNIVPAFSANHIKVKDELKLLRFIHTININI